jgi:FHS family L-fucose permease-like MFS transporter
MSGPVIPVIAARAFGLSWRAAFPVFSVAILIALLSALTTPSPESRATERSAATLGSCLALLKNRYVATMVLGIFLYVGAEVCVSSGIPLYLEDRFGLDITKTGLLGTGLFFAALTVGRFSGGVVLNWMKPGIFLALTCAVSLLGLVGLFLPFEKVAVACFIVAGLGFANVFPLIFSIAIDHMPEQSNPLAGLMVTAIVGAAFLPPLMGLVADTAHSVQLSFVVPLAAILYVSWVAVANLRQAHVPPGASR